MATKRRYAQVGVGGRARMYYEAITGKYHRTCELVGFCDVNQTRMDFANRVISTQFHAAKVPTYNFLEFEKMIVQEKPDIVIVTSIDRTHHHYIVRALELGCDVITEKPMTIDAEKCQDILDAIKKTGKSLRVTFNYRYAPHCTKVRQLLAQGIIGDIFSVHFEWLLDTKHGADYFRRWHRDKRNSGGLLVHKATHHFDLVNFWLATYPETVFAFGDLRFYGRENAERRGIRKFYSRAYGSAHAKNDPFALHLEDSETHRSLYLQAEAEDGYYRDQSVFGDGISIEDTMGVLVRYKNKSIMSYSLNAYMPWEGFRIVLNGNKGRIEVNVVESSYVSSGEDKNGEGTLRNKSIRVLPLFAEPYEVDIEAVSGDHGGSDPMLLEDLFGSPPADEFKRAANHIDGAMSILVGIAANKSMMTGRPINVGELVSL